MPVVGAPIAALTNAGVGTHEQRFNPTTFAELARRYGAQVIHRERDRNAIAVLPPA
jgi:hypothetical protein